MKAFRYTALLILFLTSSLISLSAQDVIISEIVTTPTTCSDGTEGTVSFSISGGVPAYTWAVLTSTFFPVVQGTAYSDTSIIVSGLSRASYFVLASDQDGNNEDGNVSISIGGPGPVEINFFNPNHLTCNNTNDGALLVTAIGESGSYDFTLSGPSPQSNTSGSFSGLLPGDYTVLVEDAGSCTTTDVTPTISIINPGSITATEDNITNVGCFGDFTGSIAITPNGGTPSGSGTGYTYAWTGPNSYSHSDEDILDLEAGDYFVTITDGNGCFSMLGPFTVAGPTQINVILVESSDAVCNGGSNGSASISASGGWGSYSYSWVGLVNGPVSSDEDPNNLVADTYDLIITDGGSCTRTFSPFVTIKEPLPFAISVDDTTNVKCNGDSNGAAEITASGNTPGYNYAWTGAVSGYTSFEEDPTGMPADVYSVTIRDINNCSLPFLNLLTIEEPPALVVSMDGSTDVSCFGGNNGEVNITVTGGTAPYSFEWVGNASLFTTTAQNPDNLVADSYLLIITDASDCVTLLPNFVTIGQPDRLNILLDQVTNIACFGDSTGAIDIVPLGGSPDYSFVWTSPNGFIAYTQDISSLEPGTYSLTLTDSEMCSREFSDTVTLTENSAIEALFDITTLSCGLPLPSSDGGIDVTVTGGTPDYSYDWTGDDGFSADTKDLSGISAGSYVLEVTDILNCVETFPAKEVLQPEPLTATTIPTNVDCFGAATGAIDLTAEGGTAPYDFDWTGPSGNAGNTEDISGLEAGAYSVTITDGNNCVVPFDDITTLSQPEEIVISSTKIDISCNGQSDGSIDVTVEGGILPYLFDWEGPSGNAGNTEDISGLEAGPYKLTITDGNSCIMSFPLVETITEPLSVTVTNVLPVHILCNGDSTGTIDIDVAGGITPYIFDWTNASGSSVSSIEDPVDLPAGTYSLTITDGNDCEFRFDDRATITEPGLLSADLGKTDITCFGDGDGSITVTPSGGTAPYVYSIDGSSYQGSTIFSALDPDFYTILTRDNNMCEVSDTITVLEPDALLIGGETTSYPCSGPLLGEISINDVSGGVEPYQYSINGGIDYSISNLFTGLNPGSYQTAILDASGCPVLGLLNVLTPPPAIEIDSFSQIDIVSCADAAEGSIFIRGKGGTGDITYSLDGASPLDQGEFEDLLPGNYTITLSDENGCPFDTIVEILAPPALQFDLITVVDVTICGGNTNGSITIDASGGTGALEYSLDDISYQSEKTFDDLAAGDYDLWIRDANACTTTATATITEPVPVTATVSKTDAIYGALGTITISDASGGTPPYEYSIDGPSGSFSDITHYTDLAAGIYEVVVKDLDDCSYAETVDILDVPPLSVLLDTVHVSCFGENDGSIEFLPQDATGAVQYSIDSGINFVNEPLFENLAGNTSYDLVAIDEEGKVFTAIITIKEPAEIILSHTMTPAECNAFSETGAIDINASGGTGSFSFLWSDGSVEEDRSNLGAGSYDLLITDENLCTLYQTLTVDSDVSVNANAGNDTSICFGSTLTLQGSGNGSPAWNPSPFLDDVSQMRPLTKAITETATFVLTITETASVYGCYNRDTVVVDLFPLIGLQAMQDTFVISGNSIQLEVSGGPFQEYRWEPETALDNSLIADPIATPLEPIWYFVYGLSEYGCEESDSLFIDVIENVHAYNVFTPNDDGFNDFFEIENAERFPEMQVEIYSRWGDLLYSTKGYDVDSRWDGYTRGKKAPLGTYYYIMIPYPGAKPISGNVTIIR